MREKDNRHDHLGSGWQFPIGVDERGRIAVASYEEKVRQSIRIILSTAKGERVMRPEFGCDIHSFTFATINSTNLMMMRSAVREALERWEPRIDVLEVAVSVDDGAVGRLAISVAYRVRSTNFETNLVYPFFLNAGG